MRAARIEDNEIVFLSTEKTPTNDSYDQVLNKLIELITSVFSKKTTAIGIGVPSVVDVEHGIIYDVINIPSWKEVPLKSILESHFKVPVFINNDANCFALGEKHFGIGKSYNVLFISFSKKEYASEREPPNMMTSGSIAKIKTFKNCPR